MKTFYVACAALALVGGLQAQERAAGNATETQMTWSALKSAVDTARAESAGAHDRIDMILACNKKQMIYSPETTGKDAGGCVANKDISDIIKCGKDGKFFDGTACKAVTATASSDQRWGAVANFTFSTDSYPGSPYITASPLGKRIGGTYSAVRPCTASGGSLCTTKDALCYTSSAATSRHEGSADWGGTVWSYPITIQKCQ